MQIKSDILQFINDSWMSHMIVFIVAGILLFIPDSWLIDLSGFSIPASWKPFIFIFFLLSSILLLFDYSPGKW